MIRRISLTRLLLAGCAGLVAAERAVGACTEAVARLVVIQGAVQSQGARGDWHPAANAEQLCAGDRVRTLERSRATLQLNDETYLSLDQRTTIVLSGLNARMPSWLDLLKGALYLRSRTPSSLDVKTPFINAAIKGTEFLVASGEAEGQVTVFEGRVEASNPKGSVTLDSGQTATAQAGQAPVRKIVIAPANAVQWALYYPPLIDLAALRRAAADPAVKRAAALYLAGDSLGALRELEADGTAHRALRASLLLSLGRLDEAQPLIAQIPKPEQGQALALRSVIALTRGDRSQALLLAEQATQAQPSSPVPWTALSYARQAQFDLPAALAAAQKAAELAPDNGLVQTRLAELLDATGDRHGARKAAQRATELNPALARGWTLLGFTQLADLDRDAAQASFDTALRTDPSDPLAHFGRGLTQIRGGELEAGTAELEIAASLDPNDSLTRSYVGKAYYEQKRSKPAQGQYDLAKQYDPKDPTPWFYDAIKKQTENRPVEALENLQKAIELNGNRAVYRSRQLLDSDLAARSSALGRIYNDLGFGQRALLEGWRSVNSDPSDYSAHRFLADSYASLPGHEVARTSELLQSQLLQPLNVTPLQPHLAERNLLLLYGGGPLVESFNEFNPLFERNRLALQTSGLVGSNDTYADEVTQSGIWNRASYSVGQFHYETRGFRPGAGLSQNIYNAFLQGNVTPNVNLQFEARHRDVRYGDINQNAFPDLYPVQPNILNYRNTDLLRGGLHYSPTTDSDVIVSLVHQDQSEELTQRPGVPQKTKTAGFRGYLAEGQYQHRADLVNVAAGGGYYSADNYDVSLAGTYPTTHGNAYGYSYWHLPHDLTLTLGLSFDQFDDGELGQHSQVNPKFGLLWQATQATTVRLAGFRTMKRPLANDQTIEPTQVAGFNQLRDDVNGTDSTRYGIGVDHRFSRDWLAGLEFSRRDLQLKSQFERQEDQIRSYLYWTPNTRWALSLGYWMEKFQVRDSMTDSVPETTTHMIPAGVAYFHDSGVFSRLNFTYVDQKAFRGPSFPGQDSARANEQFTLVDYALGYRLPNRYGIVQFLVKNLFDTQFQYQGNHFRSVYQDEVSGFAPGRAFFGQVSLAF